MSPIRFHHMSLTHPQTPINRSLPKAFKKRPSHLKHKQHQRRFGSTETLLESSPEASKNFKNFDLKCKEHSKQNHLNYLPRSQRSLESSSKASRNLYKPQIKRSFMDSSLQSPEELPPQTFKYEEHSKRNHPNYIPRSQSSLESSSKASRNLNKPQINEVL